MTGNAPASSHDEKLPFLMALVHRATDYNNPNSLGSRFRRRRAVETLKIIDGIFQRKGSVKIIDIGGWKSYWSIIPAIELEKRNCSIHLTNIDGTSGSGGLFTFGTGDGRSLDFANNSFDLVHANSVIEHVGAWRDMAAFAAEVRRLAPSYFIQTPAFCFPIEPHYGLPFLHWLAPQIRASLLRHTHLGRWRKAPDAGQAALSVEDSVLLTKAQLVNLFPDAHIKTEFFLGLPKSYTAIRSFK
jgi:hypothetical protein